MNNLMDYEAAASIWKGPETVGDFIEMLSQFPSDWPVKVKFAGGGGTAIVQRDLKGVAHVCIFNKNGGDFGEKPFTEEEYQKRSRQFLSDLACGKRYTSVHGDHRTYSPDLGSQATCYGTHYDHRIIMRMVSEGLISKDSADLERVAYSEKLG